ncbi:hypothetical protein ZEAMMB73_Zm00001d019879 [Zea mays]|uniref:Uncharacterized protein n=1 Tax=Zea mays TaxID=4577 RepID=A0A1D6I0N2_MAIZE|nr:hypothetical protein ZEAMMB73_Zm00001d019879 [Zea mays]
MNPLSWALEQGANALAVLLVPTTSPWPSSPLAAQLLHGETPLFLQPRHFPLLPRCQRCARATCSANCPSGVLRSEQHAVMPPECSLFFCAAPSSLSFTPERHPVFCEEKASRSTLVDVRSDAQIGIAIVLTNTD